MTRRCLVCFSTGLLAALVAVPLLLERRSPALAMASSPTTERQAAAQAPAAPNPTVKGPRAVSIITLTYMYGTSNAVKNLSVFYPSGGPASPVAIILPMGEPIESDPAYNFGQAQHLASWGWVVGVPGAMWSEGPVEQRDNVPFVSRVLDTVLGASSLAGKTTARAAIIGTQWNGVTARLAAAADSRFKAVVSLHAGTYGPGYMGADTAAPYLAMGGLAENDFTLCPIASTWSETYRRSSATHRARFEFGAAHPADFLEPAPESDPLGFCGDARATPFAWIKGMMTAWLEYYVKGDLSQFDNIYKTGGDAAVPSEVTSSAAANAPLNFKAVTVSETNIHLTWTAWITDTTVLDGLTLERASSAGEMKTLGVLPLDATAYDDSGLDAEAAYTYTLRYFDKGHHLFQPATAKGGKSFPTPTATPSPRPTPTITRTPTPTYTPSSTRPPTPSRTPTAAPGRFTIRLPWTARNLVP